MKSIPYDNFYIVTKLSPDETEQKLQKVITYSGKPTLGHGYVSNAMFFGHISRKKFILRQVLTYRNQFSPVIKGTIDKSPEGGSYIPVTMIPSIIAIIIFLLLYSGFFALIVAFIVEIIRNTITASIVMPICGILFVSLFFINAFWSERNNSVSLLIDLFEGEE